LNLQLREAIRKQLSLVERGAEKIRGDEAERQKAIHDKVHDDIKELNRAEGLQQ